MSDALVDLDPALFVQPPVFNVPGGIALGAALLRSMDATMPSTVQQAAERVETAVLVLERRWTEQRESEDRPQIDARTADLRLDRAWVAVGRRLEVLLDLPGHLPQAEQAAVLYRRLFPEELAFLNLPFRRQWAQSELRLLMIDDEGLRPQLEPLVGGFVLDELCEAHEEYGRVLGIDDPKAALATPARVAEGLRALRDAIAAYGLQLVAVAHADPERAGNVRASLLPIANVRRGLEPDDGLADFDVDSLFDEPEVEAAAPEREAPESEASVSEAPASETPPSEALESETPESETLESETSAPEARQSETPASETSRAQASDAQTPEPEVLVGAEVEAAPMPVGSTDDTIPLDVEVTTPLQGDADPAPIQDESGAESTDTPATPPTEQAPDDDPDA